MTLNERSEQADRAIAAKAAKRLHADVANVPPIKFPLLAIWEVPGDKSAGFSDAYVPEAVANAFRMEELLARASDSGMTLHLVPMAEAIAAPALLAACKNMNGVLREALTIIRNNVLSTEVLLPGKTRQHLEDLESHMRAASRVGYAAITLAKGGAQ